MVHAIIPGDVVRFSAVECYTGITHAFHALILSTEDWNMLVLDTVFDRTIRRNVTNVRYAIVGHVPLPSHPSKDQVTLADLPSETRVALASWTAS